MYIYVENKIIKCRTKTILHTVAYIYDENTDSNIIVTCAFNFSMLGRVCYRSSKYPAKEDCMLISNGKHFQRIDASIGRGGHIVYVSISKLIKENTESWIR